MTSEKSPLSIQSAEFDQILSKVAPTEEYNMQPYAKRVLDVFHDIEALSLSFRDGADWRHFQPSEKEHFMDFVGLNYFFTKVAPRLKILKEELLLSVRSRLKPFVKNPDLCIKSFVTHKDLRVFLIYLQLPDLIQYENLDMLIEIIQVLLHLPQWAQKTLKNWFSTLPQIPFINLVTDLQHIIAVFVAEENMKFETQLQMNLMDRIMGMGLVIKKPDYSALEPVVLLLQFFYDANSLSNKVGLTYFQNTSLVNDYMVTFQFRAWKDTPNEFSFCKFRWLLDIDFKAKVLEEESKEEQEEEKKKGIRSLTQMLNENYFGMMLNAGELIHFTLEVRRDHIIEDSLNGLTKTSQHSSFKKKLKVKFIGEPGVDEGGVKKEFFQILIKQLFDPMYGMFVEKMVKDIY